MNRTFIQIVLPFSTLGYDSSIHYDIFSYRPNETKRRLK